MKKKIAIIAGGDSSEYGVSLRSAAGIYSFLDKEKYDVTVVCLRGSDWKAEVEENVWVDIDKNDFSFTYHGKKTNFDFAYITIHGTPGENGVLQGYLDMIGLP
ncbi:MAG: D-alanine--D-alanine ligase, partial [Bacteroidaceae bacterium]|nr:D-alanine--D-alanine ligase [Bacteroidaceae bacterium]